MAVIPRYESRLGSLDPGAGAPTRQMYVPPARRSSYEDVGEALQSLAGQAGKIYQAQQERAAADYTTKTSAEIQESVIRNMEASKREALAAGNVDGFTDTFIASYDETVAKALKDAPNELARAALSERMLQARVSLLAQSMSFESSSRIKIYESNLDKAADDYAKSAAMEPNQIPQFLRQLDGDMAAASETLGLTNAQERRDAYKDKIIGTAVTQVMSSNATQAQDMIEQYKEHLSAKSYVSLSNSAQHALERQAKALAEAQERAMAEAAVFGAINDNLPLNPNMKGVSEVVNEHFLKTIQANPNADYTPVIIKTGIMPKIFEDFIVARLHNGAPEEKVWASQQLQHLRNVTPHLIEHIPSELKANAALISQYIAGGMEPRNAVEAAAKITEPADRRITEMREKKFKEEALTFNDVKRDFTQFFGYVGEDAIPEAMAVEYDTMARGYYVGLGLDASNAKTMALSDLKGRWHKSEVGGMKRYMKNAPELVYYNGVDPSWIKEQLKDDLNSFNPHINFDKTVLESSPLPGPNGKPVYYVYTFDRHTLNFQKVMDRNGMPLLFMPDFEKSGTYRNIIAKYPGETNEEKYRAYLREMEEERAKKLEWKRGAMAAGAAEIGMGY